MPEVLSSSTTCMFLYHHLLQACESLFLEPGLSGRTIGCVSRFQWVPGEKERWDGLAGRAVSNKEGGPS